MSQELETIEKLLIAAKEEFLELGFAKASLRNICKKAGVTTGALYFFFKDKDDLFASLVKKVADEIKEFIAQHIETELELFSDKQFSMEENISDGIQQSKEFVHYMYDNKDTCILLISKAQGSAYEHFLDDMVNQMSVQHSFGFVDALIGEQMRKEYFGEYILHWFAHIEVYSFAQLLEHDLTLEEALRQSEIIAKFLCGGWSKILGR